MILNRCSPNKRLRKNEDTDLEETSDATLFQLLNPTAAVNKDSALQSYSFSNLISKEIGAQDIVKVSNEDTFVLISWVFNVLFCETVIQSILVVYELPHSHLP